MTIIDYVAVAESHLSTLTTVVKQHINKGWQPQGGIAIMVDANSKDESFVQALVKYDEGD